MAATQSSKPITPVWSRSIWLASCSASLALRLKWPSCSAVHSCEAGAGWGGGGELQACARMCVRALQWWVGARAPPPLRPHLLMRDLQIAVDIQRLKLAAQLPHQRGVARNRVRHLPQRHLAKVACMWVEWRGGGWRRARAGGGDRLKQRSLQMSRSFPPTPVPCCAPQTPKRCRRWTMVSEKGTSDTACDSCSHTCCSASSAVGRLSASRCRQDCTNSRASTAGGVAGRSARRGGTRARAAGWCFHCFASQRSAYQHVRPPHSRSLTRDGVPGRRLKVQVGVQHGAEDIAVAVRLRGRGTRRQGGSRTARRRGGARRRVLRAAPCSPPPTHVLAHVHLAHVLALLPRKRQPPREQLVGHNAYGPHVS